MSLVSLSRRAFFSAGRTLQMPDASPQENLAAYGVDTRPHGHDYVLDVFYAGSINQNDGMIVNLDELKPVLADLLNQFDGQFLNDLKYFNNRPATLENIVEEFWRQLPPQLGQGNLRRVQLQETSRRWIERTPQAMKLTTKYEFAAAHRLNAPQMSQHDNEDLYGKCNNPRGHGHNYGLEVTIEGTPDARNGTLIAQAELDKIVDEEVFSRFDHRHLNEDCPEFADVIPTSENLAQVIFDVLRPRLQSEGRRLCKIGLHETQKNYFEVEA